MNVDDIYPSRFLKAADLGGEVKRLTIASTTLETMPDGKQKLVVWFSNAQKALVCNKTNTEAIARGHGKDTDGWIGKRIELFALTVQGPNGPIEGIRVRPILTAAPVQKPALATAGNDSGPDDDIPF